MPFYYSPIYFLQYFLKKQANQYFLSISIRSLALGMILIFEPIYIYFYFNQSLPLTLLFFGAIHGLYGLIAVFGGKIMSKIGYDWAMLVSHFFFFSYYLLLAFIYSSAIFIPLAIIMKAVGSMFFWPSFHTDFTRFSKKDHRGWQVGKKNVATFIPTILSPVIGGLILTVFGYPALFASVLTVLLASAIPLFFNKEKHEIYTDSYKKAWQRIFKKENRKSSLAFVSQSIEQGIEIYLWPLFMAVLAIGYVSMGGLTSFAIFVAALFTLYMGKISDTDNRAKLLNIGALLTSVSWLIKYFVITPFTAFLAQTLYKICRASAAVPFQTFFYEKAAFKNSEADEFIISREIIFNISRFFSFVFLAGLFLIFPKINLSFILAAIISFGFVFMGKPPTFKKVGVSPKFLRRFKKL